MGKTHGQNKSGNDHPDEHEDPQLLIPIRCTMAIFVKMLPNDVHVVEDLPSDFACFTKNRMLTQLLYKTCWNYQYGLLQTPTDREVHVNFDTGVDFDFAPRKAPYKKDACHTSCFSGAARIALGALRIHVMKCCTMKTNRPVFWSWK